MFTEKEVNQLFLALATELRFLEAADNHGADTTEQKIDLMRLRTKFAKVAKDLIEKPKEMPVELEPAKVE